MAKKHQVKVSSKKGRTKAGRKWRRQGKEPLQRMTRPTVKPVEESPRVKMLMQDKKWMLEAMALERGLDVGGTKLDLARRIAVQTDEEFSKAWRAIVDGRK